MPKTPFSYPATNGKAGGKLSAGNDTVRFWGDACQLKLM
jgi:hypothetical protein